MADAIQGLDRFQRKLEQLEKAVQKKVLIQAAQAGARIILADAKARAPRLTGALAEGISMKVSERDTNANEALVQVQPSRRTFWALFNEKGTKKMAAQPFMRPALEANRARALAAMKATLIAAINKAVRSGSR